MQISPYTTKSILILLLLHISLACRAEVPVIMVFGDSLSAGYGVDLEADWVGLMENRLKAREIGIRVVNASISGDTTSSGVIRIGKALQEHRPRLVILELGANDGLRGLSLTAMKNNLTGIIRQATVAGARVLLVGMRLPPNYGPEYTRRFSSVYADLATAYQLPLVPFLLAGVAGNGALMQEDGLHPAAAAQPTILDNVWPHLEPLLNQD
ncbi:MAG: arylesterase [Gammaproteobacteria bacterium]|nr:arylesterase [Gammaproteobacteria bacterium]